MENPIKIKYLEDPVQDEHHPDVKRPATPLEVVLQLGMYASRNREKAFCVQCVGQVVTSVTSHQVVLDHLSSIFMVSGHRRDQAASSHLQLVLTKRTPCSRHRLPARRLPSLVSCETGRVRRSSSAASRSSSSVWEKL